MIRIYMCGKFFKEQGTQTEHNAHVQFEFICSIECVIQATHSGTFRHAEQKKHSDKNSIDRTHLHVFAMASCTLHIHTWNI